LFAAKAFAVEPLPLTFESGSITYTVKSAYLATHSEDIVPPEGAEYLFIQMTAKNTSPKRTSLGGIFGKNFSAEKGGFKYDVDAGVGWQSSAYSGAATLEPLVPKKLIVIFSVPSEIAVGTWTVHFPGGENFDIDADRKPAKQAAPKKNTKSKA
jgi:hypothetical protein